MLNTVTLKRAVVFTLIAALLSWTVTAYGISLISSANAASAGDLIKMDGNPAVYYLGSDSKRYVFPNSKTYNTWYADFSGVVTVSSSELQSYAIGGNVTYRAGTMLVKITTDPKVYAVEPGGVLRWVTSESVATDLFGSNWNTIIEDVPDAFFVNYSTGSDITSSTFPSGSLVSSTSNSDVFYIDGSSKRMIADSNAMSANRFRDEFVRQTSLDLNTYTTGSSIVGAETDLATTAGPEVGTPSTSSVGTLSVSLASDTPAASTVVENAARVGFTKINLTATGGDVTVDSLVVERTGISSNTAFADVILLDVSNNTPIQLAEQIDNEKNLTSDNLAVFNKDITVTNGTTKSLMISANMAGTLNAGEVGVLAVTSITLGGSATLSGSLPVSGNGMTMNGSVAIASVEINTGGQDPSATTQNVGTNDYVLTSLKITVPGSQEDVEIHRILFTNNGTADNNDFANLELVVDGSVVATVAAPINDLIDFPLNPPILIGEGNNKEFVVRGDIIDGSGRTISLDIEDKIDVVARGKTFGFFRLPTFLGANKGTVSPFFNADDTTIDKGSISFSKGVLSSLNVAEGADTQVLGAFKATVQGEPVEVTQFVVGVSVTGTGNAQDITNLKIKDANGLVVAGSVDPDSGVTARDTATTTDTIVFPIGTNTYTIEGDLTSDFGSNDTIQLDLPDPDGLMTAEGQTTGDSITPNPTADLSLDTVTVKVGDLKVSTAATPAAQSVIVGQSGFVFANFVLDASGSGEDIRVTQIAVKHTTGDDSDREDHIANLQIFDGSTALLPIKQPVNVVTDTTATTTISLTSPIVVAKGTSKIITLKGDIIGGVANDTHSFGANGSSFTATGVETANSITITATESAGQTMTIVASGSLTVAEDASSPQSDGLLVGGASKVTIGELLLTANNEDLDLTDIHLTASAINSGALNDEFSTVYLFDGSTQVASAVPTTTAAITFENLDGKFIIVKSSGGKRLTVKVDTASVTDTQGDGNTADSGDGISIAVAQDGYSAKGTSSGTDLAAGNKSGTFTGKQFTVHKSVPTFAKQSLSSNTLVNSSGVALYRFKLTADPKGDIGFYKASFSISTSTATVTSFELFEQPGSSNINLTNNGVRTVDEILTASSDGKGGEYGISVLFDTGTDGVGSGGEFRFISAGQSKIFELQGTVVSSVSGSTVSVSLRGDDTRNTSAYPDKASGVDGDEDDDFIWSDLHYGNSSSTATQTLEWFNSYKVPGLNSTSTAENLSR